MLQDSSDGPKLSTHIGNSTVVLSGRLARRPGPTSVCEKMLLVDDKIAAYHHIDYIDYRRLSELSLGQADTWPFLDKRTDCTALFTQEYEPEIR